MRVFLIGLTVAATLEVAVPDKASPPHQQWSALCRDILERGKPGYCFTEMRRLVTQSFPAAMVRWEACGDLQAAERWGWAALMEREHAPEYLEALKRACD